MHGIEGRRCRVEAERQWRADHARENFWKGFRGEVALPWPPEWTTYTLDQLGKGRFARLYLDADGTVAYGQYELLPKLPE